jgi:hypothetical protein
MCNNSASWSSRGGIFPQAVEILIATTRMRRHSLCFLLRSESHRLVTSNPAVAGEGAPLPVPASAALRRARGSPATAGEVAQIFRQSLQKNHKGCSSRFVSIISQQTFQPT